VAHAIIATSSPFKQGLEEANVMKLAKEEAAKERALKREEKKQNKKIIPKKMPVKKSRKKVRSKPATVNRDSESDDDAPLSAIARQKENICAYCKMLYRDPNDPLLNDDWVISYGCFMWCHETCAEVYGILEEDDNFLCRLCIP
jgi:hypothetical protein